MRLTISRISILFCLFSLTSYPLSAQEGGGNPGKESYLQGRGLERQNRLEEAAQKYAEAERLEPDNYIYSYAEGKVYYKLRRYDVAKVSFEESIQKNPSFTTPYSLLAKIYMRDKDYDKAISYYDEAFRHESNEKKKIQYKLLIVQMLASQDRLSEAQSHINDAKQVDPNNVSILYYDAKISNKEGNYENAKSSMLIALKQMQSAPPAKTAKYYYELGVAYNELGDYQNAKSAWQKANFGRYRGLIAKQLSENSPSHYYKMAVSYYLVGEYSRSDEQLTKALELQNDFSPAFILRAKIARKQGSLSNAVGHYQEAIRMEQDRETRLKLQLAAIGLQMDAGDYSGALSTANQILQASPGNPRIMYNKALAQYKLGQYSSAVSTLETILSASDIGARQKAEYNFILGMAAKNTDKDKAKNAFKRAAVGPYKAAAQNELSKLLGKS